MVKYWLCVTNEENWKVVKNKNVWGVSERHRKRLKSVEQGDFMAFYVKRSRIGGIFVVVSDPFVSDEKVFSSAGFAEKETFPHRVRVKPIIMPEELKEFRPLIPKLKFIPNRKRWSAPLRAAMKTIPKEDFELIKKEVEES